MHMVLQWLSGGNGGGATIRGGDGALNLALYPPDANPGLTYAHCSCCSDEKSQVSENVRSHVRTLISRNKSLKVGIFLQ